MEGYFDVSQSTSEKLWPVLQMTARKCELSLCACRKRPEQPRDRRQRCLIKEKIS